MRLPAFVCLSVLLLARLLKNACMDFIHAFIHSNFKQVNSIKQSGIVTILVN